MVAMFVRDVVHQVDTQLTTLTLRAHATRFYSANLERLTAEERQEMQLTEMQVVLLRNCLMLLFYLDQGVTPDSAAAVKACCARGYLALKCARETPEGAHNVTLMSIPSTKGEQKRLQKVLDGSSSVDAADQQEDVMVALDVLQALVVSAMFLYWGAPDLARWYRQHGFLGSVKELFQCGECQSTRARPATNLTGHAFSVEAGLRVGVGDAAVNLQQAITCDSLNTVHQVRDNWKGLHIATCSQADSTRPARDQITMRVLTDHPNRLTVHIAKERVGDRGQPEAAKGAVRYDPWRLDIAPLHAGWDEAQYFLVAKIDYHTSDNASVAHYTATVLPASKWPRFYDPATKPSEWNGVQLNDSSVTRNRKASPALGLRHVTDATCRALIYQRYPR